MVVRPVKPEHTRALRQAILRPHQSVEDVARHEAPGAFAVGAFEGEELVAAGLVAPDGEPGGWRVRGMATVPRARDRGVGRAVLDALVSHAVAGGARRIWCNARVGARSLYARAGFEVVSDEFDIPGIGPHVVMEMRTTGAAINTASSDPSKLRPRAGLHGHVGLLRKGHREEYVIATKFARRIVPTTVPGDMSTIGPLDGSAEHVHRSIEGSLQRLGIDYVVEAAFAAHRGTHASAERAAQARERLELDEPVLDDLAPGA